MATAGSKHRNVSASESAESIIEGSFGTSAERSGPPKHFYGRRYPGTTVFEETMVRIRQVREMYDHLAVGFSGGKDSTVVLCATLKVAHEDDWEHRYPNDWPLRVIHWDEEAVPFETEHYVRRVAQRPDVALEWYCLPVKHRNACSPQAPWWYPWAPEDEEKWVRPLPPEAITGDMVNGWPTTVEGRLSVPESTPLVFQDQWNQGRSCGLLMGIRAQESLTRLKACTTRKVDGWIKTGAHKTYAKIYPIYDWTHKDIWSAIKFEEWDYNEAYDLMEMAGVNMMNSRCAPPFGEEPMQSLWQFSVAFPSIWIKMTERVPGATTAARYARTELYGHGSKPPKHNDETYQEFVRRLIDKFEAKDQPYVANQCRKWINFHFGRTTDPLLWHGHPRTGVGWWLLLNIAYRGDFKSRQQAHVPGSEDEVRWVQFNWLHEMRCRRWAGRLWELGDPNVHDDPTPPPLSILEDGDLALMKRRFPVWLQERIELDGGGGDVDYRMGEQAKAPDIEDAPEAQEEDPDGD